MKLQTLRVPGFARTLGATISGGYSLRSKREGGRPPFQLIGVLNIAG
jgi:hypothetical protein